MRNLYSEMQITNKLLEISSLARSQLRSSPAKVLRSLEELEKKLRSLKKDLRASLEEKQ